MNRLQLVEAVAADTKLTKADAGRAVASVMGQIQKALKKGDRVSLLGFGTFAVRKRAARKGRNPRTGEAVKIKASKAVSFKAGQGLKGALNPRRK